MSGEATTVWRRSRDLYVRNAQIAMPTVLLHSWVRWRKVFDTPVRYSF